ncbi:hypothetical protein THRCLA_21471 [Thraustotheca clavata]|uniref:Uncharacterized protein n=1 Tax=Thraustotheca clavata TaxID=74557 RepID=A0A1V9ZW27_9STRA|nr:hypothetical protein THRCLA_21471 [Thraustotheca clavata]
MTTSMHPNSCHRYEAAVRERYAQFGGKAAIQIKVIRYCMEPWILYNIARYRWKIMRPIEEVSDSEIYAYFKTDCEKSTAAISTFQSRVKRELRCDESIKVGASRILCMASTYDKICHEAGFCPRPEAVQQRVRSEVLFSKKRYKAWNDFISLCIDHMNAWCLFEGARPSQNGSNGNGQTTGKSK